MLNRKVGNEKVFDGVDCQAGFFEKPTIRTDDKELNSGWL